MMANKQGTKAESQTENEKNLEHDKIPDQAEGDHAPISLGNKDLSGMGAILGSGPLDEAVRCQGPRRG